MSNFGIILAQERKSRNINQKELANEIGITQAQISYYESGTNFLYLFISSIRA